MAMIEGKQQRLVPSSINSSRLFFIPKIARLEPPPLNEWKRSLASFLITLSAHSFLCFAFQALGVGSGSFLLHVDRRDTPETSDQVVLLQKEPGVVEALLAYFRQSLSNHKTN